MTCCKLMCNFQVALFAEAFTEMMYRDAAFAVYKTMLQAPDPEVCSFDVLLS